MLFRSDIEPVRYEGIVWCLTVPTGAFVVRRNGKVFVTGNSGFPKSHDIGKAIDKQRNDKQETLAVTSRLSELASVAGISRKDVDSHMGTSDMGGWWLSTLPHRCVVPSVENWAKLRDFIPGAHEIGRAHV